MRIHYPVINKKKAGQNKTHIIFFSLFLSAPGSELLLKIWASREKLHFTFDSDSHVVLLMWNIFYVYRHIKNKHPRIYKIWYYLIFTERRNLYRSMNIWLYFWVNPAKWISYINMSLLTALHHDRPQRFFKSKVILQMNQKNKQVH